MERYKCFYCSYTFEFKPVHVYLYLKLFLMALFQPEFHGKNPNQCSGSRAVRFWTSRIRNYLQNFSKNVDF
jgi:hypothetical protein